MVIRITLILVIVVACQKKSSSGSAATDTPDEIDQCLNQDGAIVKVNDQLVCQADAENAEACQISQTPKGLIVHCGSDNPIFVSTDDDNQNCTVSKSDLGSTISCPGIKDILVRDGMDGASCTVSETAEGAAISCLGQAPVIVSHGEKGDPGEKGEDGIDGIGCIVTETSGGAIVTCGSEGNTVAILHGEDGADSVTEVIDPCGPHDGFDEVILLMSDGSYIAYFEKQGRRFLVRLEPSKHAGRYVTTDDQKCFFRILDTGELVWP